ncbi:MAG: carboxypeptidase-like regulatory domain-containing protein [Polyangiaceae bacterium]
MNRTMDSGRNCSERNCVAPPPECPTQLAAVTPVGDQATGITGHYRFYMYSRADQHSTATSGPSWAVGTQESVCSLFDYESTLKAGPGGGPLPLQGPSGRTLPIAPGLGVSIPDGMVYYDVSLRTAAAWELFSNLYNMVEAKGFPGANILFGGSLDQLADSVGNQVVNCFSTDGCGDSSNAWHNVGPGIAVSPDDIRRTWATPGPNGGTYGYSEPAIYVESAFRHQYAWAATTGAAQVTVNVVDGSGNPVAQATVVVDSVPAGTTNSSGALVLDSVTAGSHDLQAGEYTGDGGIQPLTPLTESAMEALPSCSASSSAFGSATCSVIGGAAGSGDIGPSCPSDFLGEECLPHSSTATGNHFGFTEICACFPPPTPQLSCEVELTADHLVTVPSGGSVSFELTLCTTCANGVPNTSCTQLCQSDADCAGTQQTCNSGVCTSVPTIDVAIQTTMGGPIVCVQGSGFSPATSFATLSYSNIPGQPPPPASIETSAQVQVLPDGTLTEFSDPHWSEQSGVIFPTNCGEGQNVTISVTDQLTGQVATFTESALSWCPNAPAATLIGDFCCGDSSLPPICP